MATWKTMTMAILVALAGCAGVQMAPRRDLAAGHWNGEIDRDGWVQPLTLNFERENGVYKGIWRSEAGLRSRPLESVDVQGDEVRFTTDKLLFVGHVNGSTLSGTVSQKAANARLGEFSVKQQDLEYPSGSEWPAPLQ